jgi:hypothetical protein
MGDSQRKIAFAGAAVALLVSAGLLAVREPGWTPRPGARPPVATTAIRTGQPPSQSGAMQTPRSAWPSAVSRSHSPSAAGAGPGEREARSAPAVAPYAGARAERAARTFLTQYVPYSYGRARAERIRAATGRLVRALERTPPRVPVTVTRADPRLISVHADATLGDLAINVVAAVDDGQRRYRVPLELRRTHGRWVVTAVGG